MKLYASGCSFVWGQELVDNDPHNHDNSKTAFPALLGAFNDGWSGSSNQAIANRTLEYCRREKPDIAVVGWSHWERVNCTPLEHDRLDRLGQYTMKASTDEDVYVNYFLNEEVLMETTRNIVEGTYHSLVNMGVKPVMFFSFNSAYVDVNIPLLFPESWDESYHTATDISFKDRKQQHPDQKQHNWLADIITETYDLDRR